MAWKEQNQSALTGGCHDDRMTVFKGAAFLSWGGEKKQEISWPKGSTVWLRCSKPQFSILFCSKLTWKSKAGRQQGLQQKSDLLGLDPFRPASSASLPPCKILFPGDTELVWYVQSPPSRNFFTSRRFHGCLASICRVHLDRVQFNPSQCSAAQEFMLPMHSFLMKMVLGLKFGATLSTPYIHNLSNLLINKEFLTLVKLIC